MTDNTLSVITVTRNAAPLLSRTIDNISAQNGSLFEYIDIDGASTDGSQEMIAASRRVDKWISEPDKGIYDAMNKGARMASGRWILFMNAGDTFAATDVTSKLISAADEHPEADVIYGDVIRCGDTQGDESLHKASDTLKGHRLAFCHQSVICRREHLLRHPFDIRHRYSADFKLFKTLQKNGCRFIHLNLPVARFDITGISTTNRSRGLADNIRVIAEVDGLIRGLPDMLHLLPTYIIATLRGK